MLHDPGIGDHDHGEEAAADSRSMAMDHQGDVHLHGEGVRNHGTEWFFNQPWAASFVWGKMLRDSVILILLAAGLLLLPRIRGKRR